MAVNHALEALLVETTIRSFVTTGGDHDMQWRIDITALVDAATQSLRQSPAVNRPAHLSRFVQLIQHWYSFLTDDWHCFPIDDEIIEITIQETMNAFDNVNQTIRVDSNTEVHN